MSEIVLKGGVTIKSAEKMMDKYGEHGFGIYLMIVDIMGRAPHNRLPFGDEVTYEWLSGYVPHTSTEEMKRFIADCIIYYQLFLSDGDYFWAREKLKVVGDNG